MDMEVFAKRVLQLQRGMVWCTVCGATERIGNPILAMRKGWPKHCGYTMTIDSPEEQRLLKEAKREVD